MSGLSGLPANQDHNRFSKAFFPKIFLIFNYSMAAKMNYYRLVNGLILALFLLNGCGASVNHTSHRYKEKNETYYEELARKQLSNYIVQDNGIYHGIKMYEEVSEDFSFVEYDADTGTKLFKKESLNDLFNTIFVNTDKNDNIVKIQLIKFFKDSKALDEFFITSAKVLREKYNVEPVGTDGDTYKVWFTTKENFIESYASNKRLEDRFKRGDPSYRREFRFYVNETLSQIWLWKNRMEIAGFDVQAVFVDYKSHRFKKIKKEVKNKRKERLQNQLNDL